MDNTQKQSSPPTFDPVPPAAPPPPVTTPPWPPAPISTFPSANPVEPDYLSANLSSGWPPAPKPTPPPPASSDASLGGPVSPLGGSPPSTFTASFPASPWTPPPIPPAPSDTSTSPLDNPWGAPPQPPPINAPSASPPWTPPASPIETSESPPTDLSHLVGNTPQPEPAPTNLNQAETLVVPSTITPETSAEPLEHSKRGLPKWLIGVGAGLLIAVLGASAYFILGIGQAPKTTSLPAVDTSKTTQQIKPPAPIATPVSQQSAPATGSASFGDLQGGGQQATRAGDLLRQGR